MWVYLNKAFVSIVAHTDRPGYVLVRGRKEGDVERFLAWLGDAMPEVLHTPNADYKYRATVRKREVADLMAGHVMDVDYPNFKGSVTDNARHNVYLRTWSAALELQRDEPRTEFHEPMGWDKGWMYCVECGVVVETGFLSDDGVCVECQEGFHP